MDKIARRNRRDYTIKEIVHNIKDIPEGKEQGLKMWIYLGNFLDYFYLESTTNKERVRMMKEEPLPYPNITEYTYSFLSGVVHHLSYKYELEIPSWCLNLKYVMKKPHFSLNAKGNLRLVLLKESPPAFKTRNIFISRNSLDRV